MRLASAATAALGIGLAMIGPTTAGASELAFDFGGTLGFSYGIAGVAAGDTFTGTVRFDPSALANDSATPGGDGVPGSAGYVGPIDLEVRINGQTFRLDDGIAGATVEDGTPGGPSPDPSNPGLSPWDFVGLVTSDATSLGEINTADALMLGLMDPTATALQGTALPGSFDLNAFPAATITLVGNDRGFYGELSTLTPAAVPEPSPVWLLGLGAVAWAARRRAA